MCFHPIVPYILYRPPSGQRKLREVGSREDSQQRVPREWMQLWFTNEACQPLRKTPAKSSSFSGAHMCQGLNPHYFHIIGDGHQPNSRGLYTHYKDSLLKVG